MDKHYKWDVPSKAARIQYDSAKIVVVVEILAALPSLSFIYQCLNIVVAKLKIFLAESHKMNGLTDNYRLSPPPPPKNSMHYLI